MSLEAIGVLTKATSLNALGLVFDEVAVNTKMLQDLPPKRKTPAVLKVLAGSLSIKLAVIPLGLAMAAVAPGIIPALLLFGGFHLAAEGFKSLAGKHDHEDGKKGETPKKQTPEELEKERVRKVLVIDGLLSVEIMVMSLPLIAGAPALVGGAALAATGLFRTLGMYGIIGGIINMPRASDWLKKREGDNVFAKAARAVGRGMDKANPYIIKGFSLAGTFALLMIGGGLVMHGVPFAAHAVEAGLHALGGGAVVQGLALRAVETVIGMAAGMAAGPVLDRLYSAVGTGIKKGISGPFKKLFAKKPKEEPAPKIAPPVNDNAKPALSSAPDVKSALNAAAEKPAEKSGGKPAVPEVRDAPKISPPPPAA